MPKDKKPTILCLLRAIRDSGSTAGAERLLLIALALRAKPENNWMCWPSYATLARDTCTHVATMKRAAKQLEAQGLIKRKVRRNRSNLFYIQFDLLAQQAEQRKQLFAQERAKENGHFDDMSASLAEARDTSSNDHSTDDNDKNRYAGWGEN